VRQGIDGIKSLELERKVNQKIFGEDEDG